MTYNIAATELIDGHDDHLLDRERGAGNGHPKAASTIFFTVHDRRGTMMLPILKKRQFTGH